MAALAQPVVDELSASQANSTEEDPYQVYTLRRPHERASSVVPQLPKQPEMADTRLRYRRIAPNARSGSIGTLGQHFPARFDFPSRPSQLDPLTSDDEPSSFAVRSPRPSGPHSPPYPRFRPTNLPPHPNNPPQTSHLNNATNHTTTAVARRRSRRRPRSTTPLSTSPATPPPPLEPPSPPRSPSPSPPPSGANPAVAPSHVPVSPSAHASLPPLSPSRTADGRVIAAPAALPPAMRAAFVLRAEEPGQQVRRLSSSSSDNEAAESVTTTGDTLTKLPSSVASSGGTGSTRPSKRLRAPKRGRRHHSTYVAPVSKAVSSSSPSVTPPASASSHSHADGGNDGDVEDESGNSSVFGHELAVDKDELSAAYVAERPARPQTDVEDSRGKPASGIHRLLHVLSFAKRLPSRH